MMKRISLLFISYAVLLFYKPISAQNSIPFQDTQCLKSFQLDVTYNKTLNLIFPAAIQAVDLGSADIIADKFEGVENVLRVKSNIAHIFPETNLSVITKDGKYYSFYVNYSEDPAILAYQLNGNDFSGVSKKLFLENTDGTTSPVTFEDVQMNQGDMARYSHDIIEKRTYINHLGILAFDMIFALKGIYIKDNVIFYSLRVQNKSNINYDIDFIKFYIRDKKLTKRTAIQEIEMNPLHIYPEIDTIKGKEKQNMVFALQKFTIPNDKILEIEMFEKNGGRHLRFHLNNDHIINAKEMKR